MIEAVIFDLDDTLYDEVDYCNSGFRACAGYIAARPQMPDTDKIIEAFTRQLAAGNRGRIFDAALDELGIDRRLVTVAELVEVYRNHRPEIILPEDSRKVLEFLRGRFSLALLTDGYLPAQELKVAALDIAPYFTDIIYTERLGRSFWKPSPEGYRLLAAKLNIPPGRIAVVGDNAAKDFLAPNRMGMPTVQILRPAGVHHTKAGEPDWAPGVVIRLIAELPEVLGRL